MDIIFQKLARYFENLWQIGVLDPQKGLRTLEPSRGKIPYLRAQNARLCHIFIKPLRLAHYLLADDLTPETLCLHHRLLDGRWKPARLVVETSPGNFQVWIHSKRPLSLDEKKSWLQRLKSDPAAHPENRWGRSPGFRNVKEKHRSPSGHYPLSKLIWVDWASQVLIPTLPSQPLEPARVSPLTRRGLVCRPDSLCRAQFQRPDESATDFAYSIALARRGFPDHEIRARILDERSSWENHQGQKRIDHYLERTIRRARQIVQSS